LKKDNRKNESFLSKQLIYYVNFECRTQNQSIKSIIYSRTHLKN